MISLKSLVKVAAPLAAFAISSAAVAQSAPNQVRVRSISYAGTGCPAGTVAQNISSDYKAFTLLFDSFVAETGPAVPFAEKRKNCQINVDLEFPTGWSYSIIDVDYRGYVSLEPGVTAQQSSAYYFQGQAATARLTSTMRGPVSRDYQFRDTLGVSANVWSPCGMSRALNINAQVRVDATNNFSRGVITLDSIDGQVKHIYGLNWRRCW